MDGNTGSPSARQNIPFSTTINTVVTATTTTTTMSFCDYAKWSKQEMLKAMVARGLATRSTRPKDMTKEKMIARLERADQTSTFPRFLKLSTELREMIYLFAMDGKARTRPAPPPISRTNRQIRSESLPIFFQNVAINIHVSRGAPRRSSHQEGNMVFHGKNEPMQISKDYVEYFDYAFDKGWLQHMRHFQWYISCHESIIPGGFRRDRTEKYQLMFSKNMEYGHIFVKFHRNGRIIHEKQKCIVDGTNKHERTMTMKGLISIFAWFMGISDQLPAS